MRYKLTTPVTRTGSRSSMEPIGQRLTQVPQPVQRSALVLGFAFRKSAGCPSSPRGV